MAESTEIIVPRTPSCDTCRQRKVKCDRAKPKCAQCRRGCLNCAYTPKANNTKINLHHEVRRPTIPVDPPHLAGVDELIARMSSSMQQQQQLNSQRPSLVDAALADVTVSPLPESINQVSNGMVVHFRGGESKFYSSASLVGQIIDIERILRSDRNYAALPMAAGLTLPTLGVLRDNLFQSSLDDVSRLSIIHQDPSREEVERAAAIFFQHDMGPWPIYAEDTFRGSVKQYYMTPDSDKCPATAIALWYVVCEVQRKDICRYSPHESVYHGLQRSLDESLEALHVACSNYLSSSEYVKPYIIDVQALTVASLTALQEGRNKEFRHALKTACVLAKGIGLHQAPRPNHLPGRLEEEIWVFWGLYVLDKLSLVGGADSCLLPSLSCAVTFPGKQSMASHEAHHLRLARIQLAGIQESIYTDLYSVDASCRSPLQRQQSIYSIDSDLQQWASLYLHPPPRDPGTPHASILSALEAGTRYLYAHTSCLIWDSGHDFTSGSRLIQAARNGSAVVLKALNTLDGRTSHYDSRELFSILNAHAMTPLLVLFRIAMCDHTSTNDRDMLRQTFYSILSYSQQTRCAGAPSDVAETAKALATELVNRSATGQAVMHSMPTSSETPWVSSTLAHIMEVDPAPVVDDNWGFPMTAQSPVGSSMASPPGLSHSNSITPPSANGAETLPYRRPMSGDVTSNTSQISIAAGEVVGMTEVTGLPKFPSSGQPLDFMNASDFVGQVDTGEPADIAWDNFFRLQ